MMIVDPFRRAVVLALAWCLIGLGIDPGPGGSPAPTQPAASAQRAAWVPYEFASQRATDGRQAPPHRVPTSPR
jgi:hypothetical protein